MTELARKRVSFDSEPLILVDEDDNEIGFRHKRECHQGHGQLHRAFSVFLFDASGRTLLQQRSETKPLWPMYWSNSCCSHPRRGERVEDAAHRRIREELGLAAEIDYLYKFIYQADYLDLGAEHELCHVFVGRVVRSTELHVHPDEIADWRWISVDELQQELAHSPDSFTPWFKLEWAELSGRWRPRLQRLVGVQ